MATEYEPRMDADKTVPILPRPLRRTQDRIRAQNLTGDPDGYMPTDNHEWWNGTDHMHTLQLDAELQAQLDAERAIDELYGA